MKKFKSTVALILFLSFVLSAFSIPLVRATEDSWTTLEPMPLARRGLGVVAVNDIVYAIGGYSDSQLSTNEAYDPTTDSWTTKMPMSAPRSNFGITVCQNKIYVMGGEGSLDAPSRNEVYDPSTDTWETKAQLLTPRECACASVIDGKIYLIGGNTYNSMGWPVLINSTEVYDPSTDSWTTKAMMPDFEGAGFGQSMVTSAVIADMIYVIANNGSYSSSDKLLIYDPVNDIWSRGPPMPNKISGAAAATTTGVLAPKRLYVIGGDPQGNLTQVYNPEKETWTIGIPMPTPRARLGVAVVNDILYAVGGSYAGSRLAANEQYTPIGYIPEFPSWTPMLIMLVAVTVLAVIYKRKLQTKSGGNLK